MSTIAKRLTASLSLILFSVPVATAQSAYDPAARVKNAEELIASVHKYRDDSKKVIADVEKTILVAEKLKGQATDLEIRADESKLAPKLSGAQLRAAQAQFAGDLKAFQAHAQDYANHMQQFKVTVGECSANAKQYQAEVQKYQLHTAIFHLPNIKPPHVCHALNLAERESSHIANQMMYDAQRLQLAEQQLGDAQDRLNAKMAEVPALQAQVLNENRRAVEEKKLMQEFARLKEEYETLSIEHAALAGKNTSGHLASETVSGKIKNSK